MSARGSKRVSSGSLVDRWDRLYPAVVSDVLDRMGFRQQAMAPEIRPLYPEARLCGTARPVLAVPTDTVPETDAYQRELEAVDRLGAGDVMVVSHIEGSFWGELLSTAAHYRGARGIVVDGYTRDSLAIIEMGFPTFVRGIHIADSLGRLEVAAYDVPVVCSGVCVSPGDLVLADFDGAVVVPGEAAEEAMARAEERVVGENEGRDHFQ